MTIVFQGKDGVDTYRAITLKHALALYAKTGMKVNRAYTPTNMLRAAGSITGQKYRPSRAQYAQAIADLEAWIVANGTTEIPMTDITNTDLAAALIDQKVAGAFAGKLYAFVPVVANNGWQLGVAVADERGYSPVQGKTFVLHEQAREWADSLNQHIGLTNDEAIRIVCSSMNRGR